MLKQIEQEFKKLLSTLYDSVEIDELFILSAEEVLNLRKSKILLDKSRMLSPSETKSFREILSALCKGKPIQYILGFAWFNGLKLMVNEHVLIPRPETEELIALVLNRSPDPNPIILDVGTGSGCIAISLKKQRPAAEIFALDISKKSLEVARLNAQNESCLIYFIEGDICVPDFLQDDQQFDIIVSNPPYITMEEQSEMKDIVLNHEPHLALFVPDEQPMLFYRAIIALAKIHLKRGGQLFFEINRNYGERINALLREQGFHTTIVHKDMYGNDRMISAKW